MLNLSLPAIGDSSGRPIAECAQFGSGSTWGPVVNAKIQLGQEPGVAMPIQLINSTYGPMPTGACPNPYTTPTGAGFNGILGVGNFSQDCGSFCTTQSTSGVYFYCSGGSCSGTTLALGSQVVNPVYMLPVDNNGVLLDLPPIGANGASVVSGTLTLGIGTQSNNQPVNVSMYAADSSGNFTTKFNNSTYNSSFIDSGSNGFFFPAPAGLTTCGSTTSAPGWFCPASPQNYSATNASATGSPSSLVSFQIANTSGLVSTGNAVFNNVGADSGSSGFSTSFDWGLPFFLGRKVFVGIEGKSSSLGTGPYWAY